MKRIFALVFAKFPVPGAVKTRMTPPLSNEQAAALHTAALRSVWERLSASPLVEPILVGTPDSRLSEMRQLLMADGDTGTSNTSNAPIQCWPQGDGDLGARLMRATRQAFDAGAKGVVLLGSDSPTLPQAYLESTIKKMSRCGAILGPAEDGGYYLLAMRSPHLGLLESIDWGSPKVAEQTRQRAKALGIHLHELPYWYDLDKVDDLRQASRDLNREDLKDAPATSALFNLIQQFIQE